MTTKTIYPVRQFGFATCYNVIDGDTVDLEIDLGFSVKVRHRFRLARINAPEVGKPGAAEATAFLRAQILGKAVQVESTKLDKYGRYLAEIYLVDATHSINEFMLDHGLAVAYKV